MHWIHRYMFCWFIEWGSAIKRRGKLLKLQIRKHAKHAQRIIPVVDCYSSQYQAIETVLSHRDMLFTYNCDVTALSDKLTVYVQLYGGHAIVCVSHVTTVVCCSIVYKLQRVIVMYLLHCTWLSPAISAIKYTAITALSTTYCKNCHSMLC